MILDWKLAPLTNRMPIRKLFFLPLRFALAVMLGVASSHLPSTVSATQPAEGRQMAGSLATSHRMNEDGAWSAAQSSSENGVFLPFIASHGGSSCLARPVAAWPTGRRLTVSGNYNGLLFDDIPAESIWGQSGETWKNLTSGYVFDFTNARWDTHHNQPFYIDGGADSCLAGITIVGTRPYPAPSPNLIIWDMFHSMATLGASIENFLLENAFLSHSGDGIRLYNRYTNGTQCVLKSTAQDFILRDVHIQNMHDDCVQNDFGLAGTIEDSFLDGCFTGLSATPDNSCIANHNWAHNTWTVQDTLIYMKPLLYGYTADSQPIYANNVLIKDITNGPRFAFHGVTIRAETTVRGDPNNIHGYGVQIANDPVYGRLKLASCSNNTFVWLGQGNYPPPTIKSQTREALQELPNTDTADPTDKCFRFTKHECVWTNAVAEWKTRHGQPTPLVPCNPTFYTYPQVQP